jgi:hypothetical protein
VDHVDTRSRPWEIELAATDLDPQLHSERSPIGGIGSSTEFVV